MSDPSRRAHPLVDSVFKALFGRPETVHLLRDFLNSLLHPTPAIDSLRLVPTEAGPVAVAEDMRLALSQKAAA